jgi:hypothetical protein
MYETNNLSLDISSLSFDEYVLVDCIKFKQKIDIMLYSHSYNVTFIALTKKGFYNIFEEIKETKPKHYCTLELYNNQILFRLDEFDITIKYSDESSIENLLKLPSLDFYKCCYDGVKIYYAPEAIRCHKTKKVQYTGKINLIPNVIQNMFNCNGIVFKDAFWKANKDYILNNGSGMIQVNSDVLKSNLDGNTYAFYDGCDIFTSFRTEFVFTMDISRYKYHEKRIKNFIYSTILRNPISSLS